MILKGIKPIKQKRRICGPACLEIVLRYYKKGVGQDKLKKLLGSTYLKGTTNENMIRVSRELGFKASYKTGSSIADIKKLIKKRVPVIVGFFTKRGGSHYSVVQGIDEKFIFIADPDLNEISKFKIKDFEARWFDVDWDNIDKFKKFFIGISVLIYNIFRPGELFLGEKDIVRGEMIVIERKS